MTLFPAVANLTAAAASAAPRARFAHAVRNPRETQSRILSRILRANATSRYGRACGFEGIRDAREYAERVPLTDHETLAPWIDRVARGERELLTTSPVRFMEPAATGSRTTRLVPYTSELLAEFAAATMPWLCDLVAHRPAVALGRAFWAVTPARCHPRAPTEIPIGAGDERDHFPAPLRAVPRGSLAVPPVVAAAPDDACCRYLTLRALLAAPDLSFVSVWSPVFLAQLTEALDEQFDSLLHDLTHGTIGTRMPTPLALRAARELPADPALARALRRRFGTTPPDDLGELWPRLAVISCWTDASAGRALGAVRERFPRVEIQGKGVMATEGIVSIPLVGGEAPVAAVGSHYLEFLDPRDGGSHGVHEVEAGGIYEVAITTGGGLYRYRLPDLVRVEGFLHRTARLSFAGRVERGELASGVEAPPHLGRLEDAPARAAAPRGVDQSSRHGARLDRAVASRDREAEQLPDALADAQLPPVA